MSKRKGRAGPMSLNFFDVEVDEFKVLCNECGEYLWIYPWEEDGDIFVDICKCVQRGGKNEEWSGVRPFASV